MFCPGTVVRADNQLYVTTGVACPIGRRGQGRYVKNNLRWRTVCADLPLESALLVARARTHPFPAGRLDG